MCCSTGPVMSSQTDNSSASVSHGHCRGPEMLLMDAPTRTIDPMLAEKVAHLISELRRGGTPL